MALKPGDNEFRAPNCTPTEISSRTKSKCSRRGHLGGEQPRPGTASLRGQPRVLLVDGDEPKIRPLAERLRGEKHRGGDARPARLAAHAGRSAAVRSFPAERRLARCSSGASRWSCTGAGCRISAAASCCSAAKTASASAATTARRSSKCCRCAWSTTTAQETPSVALLVVLDRSGSMTAQVGGQTKMSLANQGAVLALNVLGPRDYFGVARGGHARAHRRARSHASAREGAVARRSWRSPRAAAASTFTRRSSTPSRRARCGRADQARHPFFRCGRCGGKSRRRNERRHAAGAAAQLARPRGGDARERRSRRRVVGLGAEHGQGHGVSPPARGARATAAFT